MAGAATDNGRKCRRLAGQRFAAQYGDLAGWSRTSIGERLTAPIQVRGFAAFAAVTAGVPVDVDYVVAAASQWATHLSNKYPASAATFRVETASLGFGDREITKMWAKLAQTCVITGYPPDVLPVDDYVTGREACAAAVTARCGGRRSR